MPGSKPMQPAMRPPQLMAREGNRGTALSPARPAHTPHAGSSDKPLPGHIPAYDRRPGAGQQRQQHRPNPSARPLDDKEVFDLRG